MGASSAKNDALASPWLALALILALAAPRWALALGWLPWTGAGLGDTEAYYTAWSMDLAWGYHDHPGAIAWLLALTRTLDAGVIGTRLAPALCWTVTLAAMTCAWRRTSGPRAAVWAALLFASAPLYGTGGLLAAPDAPLAAAWACALAASAFARTRLRWALVGGAGALMLTSKLLGGALVAALVFDALTHRAATPRTAHAYAPRPALAWDCAAIVAATASLGLIPTLIFEASHDWTGLTYHVLERHTGTTPFAPRHLAAFIGGQLAGLAPILAVALPWGAWRLRHHPEPLQRRAVRVACVTWLPLALITASTREAEPHWPVLAWLPLLGPLAAHLTRTRSGLRLKTAAVVSGMCLQALVWLHLLTPLGVRLWPEPYVPRYDIANDLRGWDLVARIARAELDAGRIDRVAAYHYTVCGQLTAALGALPPVACLSRRRDAFDFLLDGHSGAADPGQDLLYVRDNRYNEHGPDRLRCDAWGPPRPLRVTRGGRVSHTFELRVCRGFRGLQPDR